MSQFFDLLTIREILYVLILITAIVLTIRSKLPKNWKAIIYVIAVLLPPLSLFILSALIGKKRIKDDGDVFSEKTNQKLTQLVNGSWSLRVGFACLFTTLCIAYMAVSWLIDVLFHGKEFLWWDWWDLILGVWAVLLYLGMTYALIRIGYEELNNGDKSNASRQKPE